MSGAIWEVEQGCDVVEVTSGSDGSRIAETVAYEVGVVDVKIDEGTSGAGRVLVEICIPCRR
jgi:hypothetical protein